MPGSLLPTRLERSPSQSKGSGMEVGLPNLSGYLRGFRVSAGELGWGHTVMKHLA